jgi:hypothetical protein
MGACQRGNISRARSICGGDQHASCDAVPHGRMRSDQLINPYSSLRDKSVSAMLMICETMSPFPIAVIRKLLFNNMSNKKRLVEADAANTKPFLPPPPFFPPSSPSLLLLPPPPPSSSSPLLLPPLSSYFASNTGAGGGAAIPDVASPFTPPGRSVSNKQNRTYAIRVKGVYSGVPGLQDLIGMGHHTFGGFWNMPRPWENPHCRVRVNCHFFEMLLSLI